MKREKGASVRLRLKARHVIAWGEALRAEPQIVVPLLRLFALQGRDISRMVLFQPYRPANDVVRITRASTRDARSRPGYNMAGLRPFAMDAHAATNKVDTG